ncbi:lysozyme inhibitor LprI family protein [Undibacterium sp. TC4M20W]|uniref:lysozyme inhibitor LprI family protein n=1 Tax=Undibacterium sp. TC4M20W TaxID=3413052 RepID=UPI003BF17012
MRLPQLLLCLSLAVSSAGAWAQRAASGEDCFFIGGQADARTCLEQRVRDSDTLLQQTEADTSALVLRWDDTLANRGRVQRYLLSAGKQYLLYRKEQCELQAALAAGGTGGSHRRYLCILELNEQRMLHLQGVKTSLQR